MEDEGVNGAEVPKFSAFLSYSHADARAVQKLHGRLESYRLPKDLGAIATSNAKAGQGLGKVFRDREDLSAAHSLSHAVIEALGRSEVLVVVCSPDAKTSRWVTEEIAQFRKLQPGKPILAALVRGEPEDAFPDALTEGGNEPLAADLRKEGDGWRLGFLKIVAGIAGVPLDSLIQRDSQRHMRRVMAVTGIAVAAALVMAIMTTVAIQSRNEAREQRAEAEGLIEYMLTDLRDDLESVGRLDVMDRVNSRALNYYDGQGGLADLADDSLLRRARVIEELGRSQERRKNYKAAGRNFEVLLKTTTELLDRKPNDPEIRLWHAWALTRDMTFSRQSDSSTDPTRQAAMILDMVNDLEDWGKENSSWMELAALANGNRCAADTFRDELDPLVEPSCEKAVEVGKRHSAIDETGNARYALAFNAYWHALWAKKSGQQGLSESLIQLSLDQSDRLLADEPENVKYLVQRMELLGGWANHSSRSDRKELCEAISIGERVLRFDPDNRDVADRLTAYKQKKEQTNVRCL